MDRTKNRPLVTGKMSPTAALVFALDARARRVRTAGAHGEPALGRARRLGYRLLRARLHDVAEAELGPEHRDRRRGGRGAGPRRLDVGDRPPLGRAVHSVRDHLLLDAAALLGARRPLPRGLRHRQRPDASRRRRHLQGRPRDHRLHRGDRAVVLELRSGRPPELGLRGLGARARRTLLLEGDRRSGASPDAKHAMRLFGYSISYLTLLFMAMGIDAIVQHP